MSIKFKNLNNTIVKCKKCPRLVKFIKKITIEKRKQNINEVYWGKPVTGFGDTNAKLLIQTCFKSIATQLLERIDFVLFPKKSKK